MNDYTVHNMILESIGKKKVTSSYKAYYAIKDKVCITPAYSMDILVEYMKEIDKQHPGAEFLRIEKQ